MADSDFNIKAIITAQTSQFEKGMAQAQKSITNLSEGIAQAQTSTKNISSTFNKLGKELLKTFAKGGAIATGIALTTKALKGLFNTVKKGVRDYEDFQQKQKLLSQTLKVTEADTWITVEALNEMASSFQNVTNYTQDSINNLQTVLLGFKNIKGDNFRDATKAIMDMATVMGMDLVSATQTVGKALDDPIKGLGSLARQGFQFSESEKQMLADMVEMGNIAEAQKIILNELNTTYGGAAEAGAKATTQLKNSWGDLIREMGREVSLSVNVEPAMKQMNKVVKRWNEIVKGMADVKEISNQIYDAYKAVQKGTATEEQRLTYLNDEVRKAELLKKEYQAMYDNAESFEDKEYAKKHLQELGLEIGRYKLQIINIQQNIDAEQQKIDAERKANEEQEKLNKKKQEEAEYEATINDLKDKYAKAQKEQEKQWELREKVEKGSVDTAEKINFYQDQLVKIMQEAGGGITENNQYYKDQMKIISDLNKELEKANKKEESKKSSITWLKRIREQNIERLEAEKEAFEQSEIKEGESLAKRSQMIKDYNDKIKALNYERLMEEREEALKSVEDFENAEEEKARIIDYYSNLIAENEHKYTTELVKDIEVVTEKTLGDAINKMINYFKKLPGEIKNIKLGEIFQNEFDKISKGFKNFIPNLKDKLKTEFKKIASLTPSQIKENFINAFKKGTEGSKKVLTKFISFLKKTGEGIVSIFQWVGKTLDSVLKGIKGLLNKAFELNLDDSIVQLLKYEDKILTFFVETVPKLPSFVASAIQSISMMFQTLNANVDKGTIAEVISGMITNLANELPSLISNLWGLISKVSNGIVEGINAGMPAINNFAKKLPEIFKNIIKDISSNFGNFEELLNGITDVFETFVTSLADNDIFADLGNLFSKILTTIVNSIDDLLPSIETALDEIIPALGKFITDSIPSIVNLLIDLAILIVKEVPKILSELIKALPVIVEALLEALPKFFDEGLPELIAGFIQIIPDIIKAGVQITVELIKHLPEIIGSFIKGLILGFAQVNWWEVIKSIFQAFIDGFKELFGIHSPSTFFEEMGGYMVEGLLNGLKNVGEFMLNIFTKAWEGIKYVFSNIGEWASGVWDSIKDGFSNVGSWFSEKFSNAKENMQIAFSNMGEWFGNVWSDIKEGFANVGEWFSEKFSKARDNTKEAFNNMGDWSSSVWSDIKSGFGNVGSWFSTIFTNAVAKIKSAFSGIGDWFSNLWSNIKTGFSNIWEGVKNTATNIGEKLGEGTKNVAEKVGDFFSDVWEGTKNVASTIGEKVGNFFKKLKFWADGTNNAPAGLAVVGEAGPELVRFRGGEQVLNAKNTQKVLSGAGTSNNFNVTFNNLQDTTAFALMQQLKQYNRQMAINGII